VDSPKLFIAAATGTVFNTATLVVQRSDGSPFATYTLTDAMVGSYQGTASNNGASDEFTLSYSRVEFAVNGSSGAVGTSKCFDYAAYKLC
jgi:type VI protein secretion system component Hcp